MKDLELLKLVRVRKDISHPAKSTSDLIAKYKGAMTTQPIQEVDQQLNELRSEWE